MHGQSPCPERRPHLSHHLSFFPFPLPLFAPAVLARPGYCHPFFLPRFSSTFIYICSFQPLFGFPARIFSLFVAVPDPSFYRLSCTSLTLSVSFPLRSFWSFCHRGLPCLTSFSSIATRRFLFPTKVYMDLYDLIESQRYCPVTLLTVREERCVRIHYQTDTSTAPSLPSRPNGMEPGSGSWAFEGWVLVGCRIGWE